MSRLDLDFYESPHWYTTDLLRHLPLSGTVGECCVGGGAISSILEMLDIDLWTNDIDPQKPADYHFDVRDAVSWMKFPDTDWIVTNPPFNGAADAVKFAYNKANKGVAMFLRLSFLEPCENRADFLKRFPPTMTLVFPRYKFRKGKRGNWQTDSATIAALVWKKNKTSSSLVVRPKTDIWGFHDNPQDAPSSEEVSRILTKAIAWRISLELGVA